MTHPFTVTPTLQIGESGELEAVHVDDVGSAVERIGRGARVRVADAALAFEVLVYFGVDPGDARWRIAQRSIDASRVEIGQDADHLGGLQRHPSVERLFGAGVGALFASDSAPMRPVPFPRARRSKSKFTLQAELVEAAIAGGATRLIDPRVLSASQPSIHRAGVQFYSERRYYETGDTYQGDCDPLNRLPVIYIRDQVEAVIVSGHHRSTAALLHGFELEAIVAAGSWGPPRDKSRRN